MAEIVLLGTAQDGGVPHAGCLCEHCRRARGTAGYRRRPACLGLRSGDEWAMIDATSAFAEQMLSLWERRDSSELDSRGRFPAPDALVLSHAHSGHYVGLWQLDRSVLASNQVPVYVDGSMGAFLRSQQIWSVMEGEGFLSISPIEIGARFPILSEVQITPFEVPHRSEWPVKTLAYIIQGPRKRALYLPDIDGWEELSEPIENLTSGVDIAILDGCFWDAPPFPGVPHPPISDTMGRLQALVDSGSTEIVFTHLNHDNPAVDASSREAREINRRGFRVGFDGMSFSV
ncbi:MAG: MBL fold metallo-hydrolase [Chloroflexota bacterium]